MLSRKVFVREWEGGRAMLVLAKTDHFKATDSCPVYHTYHTGRISIIFISGSGRVHTHPWGAESADYMT